MAELADALGSGPSDRKIVEVQLLLSALQKPLENLLHIGLAVLFGESFFYGPSEKRDQNATSIEIAGQHRAGELWQP